MHACTHVHTHHTHTRTRTHTTHTHRERERERERERTERHTPHHIHTPNTQPPSPTHTLTVPAAVATEQLVQSVFCDASSLVQPPEDILTYPEEYTEHYIIAMVSQHDIIHCRRQLCSIRYTEPDHLLRKCYFILYRRCRSTSGSCVYV